MFFSQKLTQKHPPNLGIPNIFSDNLVGESPPLIVGLKRRTEALKRVFGEVSPLATGPPANRWPNGGLPGPLKLGYNPTYKT